MHIEIPGSASSCRPQTASRVGMGMDVGVDARASLDVLPPPFHFYQTNYTAPVHASIVSLLSIHIQRLYPYLPLY